MAKTERKRFVSHTFPAFATKCYRHAAELAEISARHPRKALLPCSGAVVSRNEACTCVKVRAAQASNRRSRDRHVDTETGHAIVTDVPAKTPFEAASIYNHPNAEASELPPPHTLAQELPLGPPSRDRPV